ncbi:hypothetical protein F0562_007540 [Nyssa sinensis]|uniref:Uncharacterized protein n=1 Tax=Nyssa sinensis TaxID=561372 RepID=A0A5J5A3L0_9ASTE|nr:hypothetical protein F0562_007540 [Nyssa sinensis]
MLQKSIEPTEIPTPFATAPSSHPYHNSRDETPKPTHRNLLQQQNGEIYPSPLRQQQPRWRTKLGTPCSGNNSSALAMGIWELRVLELPVALGAAVSRSDVQLWTDLDDR